MAKSIIITKHGGPEVLELKDVKVGPPGPEEIKIKNSAIGINFIDTYHRSGLYKLKLPTGIGMEGAGIVKEVGSEVKYFSTGDKIAYSQMPLGSYAQERIIPEEIAVKIPEGVNEKIAASIMTKGLTSHYLLFKTYKASAVYRISMVCASGSTVGRIYTAESSIGRGDRRQIRQKIPLLGENHSAVKNNPDATTTMLGPEGRSAWNDRYSPASVETHPASTL